ncbi:MAG: lysophospholipid acyltransferase family protein [Phycisphaeraceae bacterium]
MDDWKLQPAQDLGLPPGERARSLRRESGLVETCTHLLWRRLVYTYLRVYHRLRVEHPERLPAEPPFVLVANHTSHLDALVLAAPLSRRLADRVFPIAAGDVFFETTPMAIFAASMINALPMWRKSCGPHALKQLRERLVGEPCGYILFPEGGRSRDGQIKTFKAGLGMIVAGTSVPVVPCYLEGCLAALHPESMWPRLGTRITLRIGQPMTFADQPDDREGWQEVTRRLQAAVTGLGRGGEGS